MLNEEKRFYCLKDIRSEQNNSGGTQVDRPLHILLLADDTHPNNAVRSHIEALSGSWGNVFSVVNPRNDSNDALPNLVHFDVVLIHYSIFFMEKTYFPDSWFRFVQEFPGTKAVIHEDEYQRINDFRSIVKKLGINILFSCLDSVENLEKVYGGEELAHLSFYRGLPGYIDETLEAFDPPDIAVRPLDIVYRGRNLAPQLGRFANEKARIGHMVGEMAKDHDLKVDLTSEEGERIYGEAWPKFLMSGKAMLGVEGGASIFDFDGSISASVKEYVYAHPNAQFEEVWQACLQEHEGNIVFKTITPKFFDAIAAKTALVLFPGNYSGILKSDIHYIPLQPDGSNFVEVVKKLKDDVYLQDMVDRTYDEIMSRQDLKVTFWVEKVLTVLKSAVLKSNHSIQHSSHFNHLQGQSNLALMYIQTNRQLAKNNSLILELKKDMNQVNNTIGQILKYNQLIENTFHRRVRRKLSSIWSNFFK